MQQCDKDHRKQVLLSRNKTVIYASDQRGTELMPEGEEELVGQLKVHK